MRKYTINQFNKQFPDDDACLEWLKDYLYPDGIECRACGKVTKHHRITKRAAYACDVCGAHVYPKAGTIFEKSSTSMRMWFYAVFMMSSTRCGVSAKQIQRETGVTYKTAWRMFHQIRSLLNDNRQPTHGQFEVDETYVGGKVPGKRGRGAGHKSIVIGVAKRQGNLLAQHAGDVSSRTIYPIVQNNVAIGSTLFTDEMRTYDSIHRLGYQNIRVNHGRKAYVNGVAHTNTLEGFWSLLKRGINGVYHSVSDKWLQNYLNEYSFRFNHRKDDEPLFETILKKI